MVKAPESPPLWIRSTLSSNSEIILVLAFYEIVSMRATFPSFIRTTLWAKYFRPWSCVTIIIVILSLTFKSTKIFMTMSVDLVSRSPVGSSNNKIFGLFAIDRAIVTRCCSPPESWFGKWSVLWSRPTSFNNWFALSRISARVNLPYNCMGSSTFSRAVKDPIKLKVWKTNPSLFSRIEARRLSLVLCLILSPQI